VYFVVVRVGAAAYVIPAHHVQPASKGTRLQFLPGSIPDQEMPAEGGCYTGFKGVVHKAAGPLVNSAAICGTLSQVRDIHMPSTDHLIWIDLEMTGLKPDSDVIIEIATVVTDKDLAVIAEGPVIAIHQPEEVLAGMDDWNQKQHGSSGLLARVRASKVSSAEAETRTLEFLAPLVAPGASPICGNSICQDRRFLARHMPKLERFFHYRNLDVSTLKELARRWAPGVMEGFTKQGTHLAHADIMESIRELQHYRAKLFAPQFSVRR
jgi:oligoribonuclease